MSPTELAAKLPYVASILLVALGLGGVMAATNLVKKLMALNVLQVGVILFYIALAYVPGGTVPIEQAGASPADYMNPLPHTLMLTAIVVSVSGTGVALEEPELLERVAEPR